MELSNPVMEYHDDPRQLEQLYRTDPSSFRSFFKEAWEQHPESQLLAGWYERLNYQGQAASWKALMPVALLALLAGTASRLILLLVEQQLIAPVNILFGIAPFIAACFLLRSKPGSRITTVLAVLFLASAVYINLLPTGGGDAVTLAYLHLPLFLWVLAGAAYAGKDFERTSARMAYLKFNGEFAVLYGTMAVGGMLLAGLTISLFDVAGIGIEEFYFTNVVIFGAGALAVVAAFLTSGNLKLARSVTPYLAKIFEALVLVTLIVYLIVVAVAGRNPFLDRDFLLSFNGILVAVLGLTIFSIAEGRRVGKRKRSVYLTVALIILALLVDLVALSAIGFRLASFGITPNRVAVIGMNVLVFGNLLWILTSYVRFLGGRRGPDVIEEAVARFLPAYGLWAAMVMIAFPWVF